MRMRVEGKEGEVRGMERRDRGMCVSVWKEVCVCARAHTRAHERKMHLCLPLSARDSIKLKKKAKKKS